MNGKTKQNLGLILLMIIPPALLEVLNNVYNLYVPIYIQSGNTQFAAEGTTITLGFGMGAFLVGFWMMADNLFGFFVVPYVGAWSDRLKHKRGRRIPFILGSLPFVVLGYALIPLIPRLIPPELNGQARELVGFFILFTLSCILFYIGFTPVRAIYQALRQEAVDKDSRVKVESWWNLAWNIGTIVAYTAGAVVYKIYGPLLFWILLALYVASVIWLVTKYKEPENLVKEADNQESSNIKQLFSVFREGTKTDHRNLILFLVSVTFFTMVSSGYMNFTSSWAVNTLGIDESKASMLVAVLMISMVIAVLPAGYIAAGKFGRRKMYMVGMGVMTAAAVLLVVFPKLYMPGLAIMGIGAGIGFPSQLPLVTELSRNQGKFGSLIGVYNVFYAAGFMLGSTIIGAIIQATSYNSLFIAMAGFTVISFILFLFVKMPKESA